MTRDRTMLCCVLLGLGAMGVLGLSVREADAGSASGDEGRIVFASELPSHPPHANLNSTRIYSACNA